MTMVTYDLIVSFEGSANSSHIDLGWLSVETRKTLGDAFNLKSIQGPSGLLELRGQISADQVFRLLGSSLEECRKSNPTLNQRINYREERKDTKAYLDVVGVQKFFEILEKGHKVVSGELAILEHY